MSNDSLSSQSIQTVRGLYSISPEFRSQFDQLMADGADKAKKLLAELSKLGLEGSENTVEAPKKKRGRPPGSRTVNKSGKPRAKKEKPVVVEPTTASEPAHTHASSILGVITKDGLSAGEIFDAVQSAKIPGYNLSSKKVLYTSLSNMKAKGLLKVKGDRPNFKYILP